MRKTAILAAGLLLLTGCGETQDQEVHYIKTSVMYNTLTDMYQNPDDYLGKIYHMTGTLYPSTDQNGQTFYSVYVEGADGHGIGLELDYSSFEGLADYDTITVEGKLEKETGNVNGTQSEYLILRVSSLEKRESK